MTHPDRRRRGRAIRKRGRILKRWESAAREHEKRWSKFAKSVGIAPMQLNHFTATLIQLGNAEHARIAREAGIVEP